MGGWGRDDRERVQAEEAETSAVEYLVGPDADGPRKCFYCQEPFQEGEPWQRLTSPEDPEFGAYTVGIHDRCR